MSKPLQLFYRRFNQVLSSENELCVSFRNESDNEEQVLEVPCDLSNAVVTVENGDIETDTTRLESLEELSSEVAYIRAKDSHKVVAGIQMLLNIDYYLGLSPFRISSAGEITSCIFSKIIFSVMNVVLMMRVVINVRFSASMLERELRKEDIFIYIVIGHQIVLGLLQLHFLRLLWSNQDKILRLVKTLKNSTWASELHTQMMVNIPIGLRVVSFIISFSSSLFGLDVLTNFENWSFGEILSINADKLLSSINPAYDSNLYEKYNDTFNTTADYSITDIERNIFGIVGIVLNVCWQIMYSCCHDFSLIACVLVLICVYILSTTLESIKGRTNKENFPIAIAKQLAREFLSEHDELQQICVDLNDILGVVLPYINLAAILTMSRFLYFCLRKFWIPAVFLLLKLLQTWAIYIIGIKIANKASSFKAWFISSSAVRLLELSSNEYQAKLEQLNMHPIGIGTDIFYTHAGFIASLFGIVLTYFFMATDALSENSCQ